MRGYGQYCPLAKAVEVLGDRWTLLIVRDMLLGVEGFNALERGLPGISRALLAQRLRFLCRRGVVERVPGPDGRAAAYRLTAAGRELRPLVEQLADWGARWAFGEPEPDDLDPRLLLWWMCGGVLRDRIPERQVVVQFDFPGASPGSLWLVLDRSDVSLCLQPPGFEVDLLVTAELAALLGAWVGRRPLDDAVRAGAVRLDGAPTLARAFPTWWRWSPAAPAAAAAAG